MKTIFTILILCGACFAQSFKATVKSVGDGDTLSVIHADGNVDKVRLLGVDAPEVAHNSKEISQPFGEKCRDTLKLLIAGKQVFVETERRDSYGRNLGRVIYGQIDVGLFLLNAGCAWSYYPNGITEPLRANYLAAFEQARTNKVGLFSLKRYVTPTVWRKRKHLKRKPRTLRAPKRSSQPPIVFTW